MNTRNLVLGLMFFLAAAVMVPSIAYISDEPGTVVDPKDFAIDSFALLSDEPGTVVDPMDFAIDSFKSALLSDESGTILNIRSIVVDSIDVETIS